MILLDTDHLWLLSYPESPAHAVLHGRMRGSTDQEFALPIVAVEEQVRGWLARLHASRTVHGQIPTYSSFIRFFNLWAGWTLVTFGQDAADQYEALRKQRVRVGTQDLKIASIAIVRRALLLSANLRDFRKVLGLRVENWLA